MTLLSGPPQTKVIVLAGPTASGKTALSLQLAHQLNAEIINADSQQVYRYFDIGTAKPSDEQQREISHHLISMVDPLESFSAAKFAQMADSVITDVTSRGKRVLVVGGTGLYIRVLLHGVVAAPPRDEALRAQWEALANAEGDAELHRLLQEKDPAEAARLPSKDRVRIIRALEIEALTGQRASEIRQAHRFANSKYDSQLWVLNPPRERVYEAINARTKDMFARGLVDETRSLVAQGYREAAPMRAVGYAQALQVLDGTMSEREALESVAQATRHYAKRQVTWFKKEPGAKWIAPEHALTAVLQSSGA